MNRTTGAALLAGILAVVTVAVGCSLDRVVDARTPPAEQVDARLVRANNALGFKLLQELWGEGPGRNLVISPASISMALAMCYIGAAGDTAGAMAAVMEVADLDPGELDRAFRDLGTVLGNPDPRVETAIANSLWARQEVTFLPDFVERNREYFGAEFNHIDFHDPAAADRINAWVSRVTRGKIDRIVEAIAPDDVLFIINALYFKGAWQHRFDPAHTAPRPFSAYDGTTTDRPMMARAGEYRYAKGDDFQVVSLPYGQGRVSMYLVLPDAALGLYGLLAMLNAESWEELRAALRVREGRVMVPRFSLEQSLSLKPALSRLGMAGAFDPDRADFSAMCPAGPAVFIGNAAHKVYLDVNEEGTEAAAVTGLTMKATSMPVPFEFVADRPFLLAIVDDQTGVVLFAGVVTDPR